MLNKYRRVGILVFVCVLTASCSSSAHYKWGNYEDNMFDYYHEPGRKDKVISEHIKMLETPLSEGKKFAPGMYAEAGTFYLEQGNLAKAIEFYQLERNTWVESHVLMDALIENLQQQMEQINAK